MTETITDWNRLYSGHSRISVLGEYTTATVFELALREGQAPSFQSKLADDETVRTVYVDGKPEQYIELSETDPTDGRGRE